MPDLFEKRELNGYKLVIVGAIFKFNAIDPC